MPKATIPDVLNEGWTADMFGGSATFTQSGGMVDTELGRASRWAESELGASVYAAATAGTRVHDLIVQAEVAFVVSKLWERRAVQIDASAHVSRQESNYLTVREYQSSAERTMEQAQDFIDEAKIVLGSSNASNGSVLVQRVVETGPFPLVTA